MKKVTTLFSIMLFSIFLTASYPTMAQNDNPASTTQSASDDADEDTGKWGLAGLLGLLGLLGLKRRDDDHDRRTTTNLNR
jgi:MYXO-CTERM domain-containing protein